MVTAMALTRAPAAQSQSQSSASASAFASPARAGARPRLTPYNPSPTRFPVWPPAWLRYIADQLRESFDSFLVLCATNVPPLGLTELEVAERLAVDRPLLERFVDREMRPLADAVVPSLRVLAETAALSTAYAAFVNQILRSGIPLEPSHVSSRLVNHLDMIAAYEIYVPYDDGGDAPVGREGHDEDRGGGGRAGGSQRGREQERGWERRGQGGRARNQHQDPTPHQNTSGGAAGSGPARDDDEDDGDTSPPPKKQQRTDSDKKPTQSQSSKKHRPIRKLRNATTPTPTSPSSASTSKTTSTIATAAHDTTTGEEKKTTKKKKSKTKPWRQCVDCGTTKTPAWRFHEGTIRCNRCGLAYNRDFAATRGVLQN
ncbi:hypothetical protein OC835_000876 [Tilletia horrida]|nr:hypothetical protein OC835_000876 [Tilletia horrida]KAK0565621.1 hypothetical protein OC844_001132 [Tilletia horrida]